MANDPMFRATFSVKSHQATDAARRNITIDLSALTQADLVTLAKKGWRREADLATKDSGPARRLDDYQNLADRTNAGEYPFGRSGVDPVMKEAIGLAETAIFGKLGYNVETSKVGAMRLAAAANDKGKKYFTFSKDRSMAYPNTTAIVAFIESDAGTALRLMERAQAIVDSREAGEVDFDL